MLRRICSAVRRKLKSKRFKIQGLKIERPYCISPSAYICPDEGPTGGTLTLAAHATICAGAYLAPWGGRINVGSHVFIGPYTVMYGHGGLEVGSNVLIAAHVTIIPANHKYSMLDRPIAQQGVSSSGIVIEDDVWIGTGARILDGVRIEKGAIVGAGAVVTRSVPSNAIVGGIPASIIRYR